MLLQFSVLCFHARGAASFTNGNGIYGGSLHALALQADGKILITGNIVTTVNGDDRYHIIRLNADGTVDHSFDPGSDGNIWMVTVRANGRILIGAEPPPTPSPSPSR